MPGILSDRQAFSGISDLPMNKDRPRGRGAAGNPANRYHLEQRLPFDDGWGQDTSPDVRTEVAVDRSRTAISYNTSPDIPFDRSINPYRGCEHGCIYCYARPTHAWLDLSPGLDFETRLHARPDLPALLREELARPGYQPAPLALGAITDAYQPVERKHLITRQILEILAETRHPTLIVTKAAMVERDIDLLTQLAGDNLVEVAISLTTLQRSTARTLEPRAAAPHRRLETISNLNAAGIPVRVMVAPVIPVLTEPEIESLLEAAHAAGARSATYTLLRLPLEVAPLFREWLDRNQPGAARRIMNHVRDIRGGRDNDSRFGTRLTGSGSYADLIRQRFELAARRLNLKGEPALRHDLFRAPVQSGQLTLF